MSLEEALWTLQAELHAGTTHQVAYRALSADWDQGKMHELSRQVFMEYHGRSYEGDFTQMISAIAKTNQPPTTRHSHSGGEDMHGRKALPGVSSSDMFCSQLVAQL